MFLQSELFEKEYRLLDFFVMETALVKKNNVYFKKNIFLFIFPSYIWTNIFMSYTHICTSFSQFPTLLTQVDVFSSIILCHMEPVVCFCQNPRVLSEMCDCLGL